MKIFRYLNDDDSAVYMWMGPKRERGQLNPTVTKKSEQTKKCQTNKVKPHAAHPTPFETGFNSDAPA
ncbi:uncharacterized protein BDCG_17985 [Blastomyces dermatitidis ER-3]|uniref:Uncharacterized protein n=1 Tax=Ajellomyces dermatitidis (strain ER-3 / ATCC MYA-2586) TaxID=559297 RepID=A0ABX2W1G6_AJEDR|nr:uncharacterized protein BDCG_17985 [Blastomyces dermatitidis ER-3]OAT03221.1 hypothetical protein BDCG_17985 [Blastomyces dermatitidis ER-3]